MEERERERGTAGKRRGAQGGERRRALALGFRNGSDTMLRKKN